MILIVSRYRIPYFLSLMMLMVSTNSVTATVLAGTIDVKIDEQNRVVFYLNAASQSFSLQRLTVIAIPSCTPQRQEKVWRVSDFISNDKELLPNVPTKTVIYGVAVKGLYSGKATKLKPGVIYGVYASGGAFDATAYFQLSKGSKGELQVNQIEEDHMKTCP